MKKQISGSWYFLLVVVLAYVILFFINQELFLSSLNFFSNILIKIIPIFVLVFILMSLANYFFTPQFISKHLGEKGIRKWIFIIIGGILSTGAIYMWYPFLADLKTKGLSYGLISCFLYNKAIKIPLLPLMIFYFSWKYVLILSFVMIFISVIQGIVINKFMESKK
jgi:uncharacterized membrane protein YraQ (UPF0718 family)